MSYAWVKQKQIWKTKMNLTNILLHWIMCLRWLQSRNDIVLCSAMVATFEIMNNWPKYLDLNCFQEKSWVLTFKSFLWLINTLVWWNLFCRFRLVFILRVFFIIFLLWRIGQDISYLIVSEKKKLSLTFKSFL